MKTRAKVWRHQLSCCLRCRLQWSRRLAWPTGTSCAGQAALTWPPCRLSDGSPLPSLSALARCAAAVSISFKGPRRHWLTVLSLSRAACGCTSVHGRNRHAPNHLLTTLPPAPSLSTVSSALSLPQWLNVGIYRAIGHAGVYYGFKLGHTVPWVSGFPFNVVAHPQYVGSVATVLGGAALVSTGLPGPAALRLRACEPGLPCSACAAPVPGGAALCPASSLVLASPLPGGLLAAVFTAWTVRAAWWSPASSVHSAKKCAPACCAVATGSGAIAGPAEALRCHRRQRSASPLGRPAGVDAGAAGAGAAGPLLVAALPGNSHPGGQVPRGLSGPTSCGVGVTKLCMLGSCRRLQVDPAQGLLPAWTGYAPCMRLGCTAIAARMPPVRGAAATQFSPVRARALASGIAIFGTACST